MYTFKSINIFLKSLLMVFLITLSSLPSFAHWGSKGPWVGGSVKCFAAVDTILYVGSSTGGVYYSKNKALNSWTYVNYTGLTTGEINALTSIGSLGSASGLKVIAGTPEGIFVSRDKGVTWTASNSGLSNINVTALVNVGSYVFAGTDGGGIFISSDSAKTWTEANSGITNKSILCFVTNGTYVAAGTKGGVFASLNNGGSWTAGNTGLTDLNINSLAFSGLTLLAGTPSGVFKANTFTMSWNAANTGLIDTHVNNLFISGSMIYAATDFGVYTSPTSSISWTAANTGYNDKVNAVVEFNGKVYAGTPEDGIIRSTTLSPISWSQFNTGFNNLETRALYNSGNLVIVATNKGLYVSRDLAASYQSANNGLIDSLSVTSLSFAGTNLYAATRLGGVYVSADTGRTWITANTGLSSLNIRNIISSNSTIIAVSGSGDVYSTSAASINWTICTGYPSGLDTTSLATDGTNFYLGNKGVGVYKSTDGSSWSSLNNDLTNINVTSLAVKGTTLFAGTYGGGVFKYTSTRSSWTAVNNGLSDLKIQSLCSAGKYVVAGYKGGVAVTTSDGYEWKAPDVLLYIPAYADVNGISFSSESTRIFIATPKNTIYSNSVAELPSTAEDPNPTGVLATSSKIGKIDITPNPNSGKFKLDLNGLSAKADEVIIYNQTGVVIGRLSNANDQFVTVNYPKGIYYVQIVTKEGVVVQKMIIE